MIEPYISIDIETTGLNPEYCQIIEFAAIIDDGVTPIEKLNKFHCLVLHKNYIGEPYALQMNQQIFKELAGIETKPGTYQYTEAILVDKLQEFMREGLKDCYKGRYTPAGKNYASFDKLFLEKLPDFKSKISWMLKHRTLDPGNLYWNSKEDGLTLPDTKKCLERAGLEPTNLHRALGNAIDVIRLIRYKMEK